ncbi:MAG: capsular exopolysaccharide synthesis family protein [Halocynthiibacter sp.]|jgi:succinoglycan biosynthesis transport protein ExoP
MNETRIHRTRLQAPAHQKAGDKLAPGALWRTLWNGKWLIGLIVAACLMLGALYVLAWATPLYTATAALALEAREEQVIELESVMAGLGSDQATVNTELEVIRSRRLLETLALELDLVNDPEFNAALRPAPVLTTENLARLLGRPASPSLSEQEVLDDVVLALLQRITVSNIRDSYVFRISAISEDRIKSAELADSLASLYMRDQLQAKFEATEAATKWLTERVAELKIELARAETSVKELNAQTDLISAETLMALNRQLKELRERAVLADITASEARVKTAKMKIAQEAGDLPAMAAAAADRELISALERIAQDEPVGSRLFDARFSELLTRLGIEAARQDTQAQTLRKSVAMLERQIESQSEDLLALEQLEREAEASRLIYEYFLSRLKETSVQQGIQQADSRVISNAMVPREPSSPRLGMILSLAALLGLMLGGGWVILREMAQATFRTSEDLEAATGLTVMGKIPTIPLRKRGKVLQYLTEKPTSAAAEAVRNLRTSTLMSNVDHPPKVIMITSSLPGEGKTTQAIALAQNLSGLGARVLLIEGDIRRQVFGEYFETQESTGDAFGLLKAISGALPLSEAVQHSKALGADILVGTRPDINAADLFSSERFASFLQQAREAYDYVIIDTPPCLIVPDARVIARHVDAVLYTVRWDSTPQRQVLEGLRGFAAVNLGVTGLVLSQVDPRGMRRYGQSEASGEGYYAN